MTTLAQIGVLVIEVPLPYRALSPNSGRERSRHWSYQAGPGSPRQTYRNEVKIEALDAAQRAGWKHPQRARVSLVFGIARDYQKERLIGNDNWKPYRPDDLPNAVSAAKALFDGLVDARVIREDNFRVLELGRIAITPNFGPCVQITVERLE